MLKGFCTVALLALLCTNVGCSTTVDRPTQVRLVRQHPIRWETDVEAAAREAELMGAPLLVYAKDDSCKFCDEADSELSDERVKKLVNEGFVAVKLGSDTASSFGIKLYPTFIIIVPSPSGGDVFVQRGASDVDRLLAFLNTGRQHEGGRLYFR